MTATPFILLVGIVFVGGVLAGVAVWAAGYPITGALISFASGVRPAGGVDRPGVPQVNRTRSYYAGWTAACTVAAILSEAAGPPLLSAVFIGLAGILGSWAVDAP